MKPEIIRFEVEFFGGPIDGLMEVMEMPLKFCWMESRPAFRKGSRWWMRLCQRIGMARLLRTEVVAVYFLEAYKDTVRYVYMGSCTMAESQRKLRAYEEASPKTVVRSKAA